MEHLGVLWAVAVVAAVVEAIVQNLKPLWQPEAREGQALVNLLATLILSVLLCVAADVDAFALIGLPLKWAWLGPVLTGLMGQRAANALHGLLQGAAALRNKEQRTVTLKATEGFVGETDYIALMAQPVRTVDPCKTGAAPSEK